MNNKYKTINYKFKRRWFSSEVNTEELNNEINAQATNGWQFVSMSVVTLYGYPQSAVCVYKKDD
ncbi:DUF4177 domain-containing protein [Reinekea forsetii]|nr:DUF4177 domain-containing protein [Reinekea forsetii]